MEFWEIFWIVSIIFALISFSILSVSVLVKGYSEVKEMLSTLEAGHSDSAKETE